MSRDYFDAVRVVRVEGILSPPCVRLEPPYSTQSGESPLLPSHPPSPRMRPITSSDSRFLRAFICMRCLTAFLSLFFFFFFYTSTLVIHIIG